MPVQYQRNRDGKWEAVGVATRDELTPREFAPGSADAERARGFGRPVGVRATRHGRPVVWAGPDLGWQSPASFSKAKEQGRLPRPPAAPPPQNRRTGLSWWQNEASWLLKGAVNNIRDAVTNPSPLGMAEFGIYPAGSALKSLMGRQGYAAFQVGSLDNVLKAGEAAVQWATGKEVNPGQTPWIRNLTDTGYRLLGAKPPSQQTPVERETDRTYRSLGINTAVSAGMLLAAPVSVPATAVGAAVRGGGLFLAEQGLSTALDDNTGGNASNLLEAALGGGVQVPGAVRPTDNWGQATLKSLVPNAVFAAALGAAGHVIGHTGKLLPYTRRQIQEARTASEIAQARAWAMDRGLVAETEHGLINRYSPPDTIGKEDITLSSRPAPTGVGTREHPATVALNGSGAPGVQVSPGGRPGGVEVAGGLPLPEGYGAVGNQTLGDLPGTGWRGQPPVATPLEVADGSASQVVEGDVSLRGAMPQPGAGAQGVPENAMPAWPVQEGGQINSGLRAELKKTSDAMAAARDAGDTRGYQELQGQFSDLRQQLWKSEAPPGQRGFIRTADPSSPVQEHLRQIEAAKNPDTAAYEQWLRDNAQPRTRPMPEGDPPTAEWGAGGNVLPGDLARWEGDDPWVDPGEFSPVADPSLPETDQLIRNVWGLDDEALVDAVQTPGPVVEKVQGALQQQHSIDPTADARFGESSADRSMAPGEALGLQGEEGLATYQASLENQPWDGLRALTDPENNPAVARIIEGNTGREPAQFTRRDMIEGLVQHAQADGQFVIPRPNGGLNRPGEMVVPVDSLGIDPARFQFKGDINPRTGEQLGASLDGVDAWNTDLEGVISAWRDPADGTLWTINGHNRVAAARRLGVPSLPVKVYEAPDAATARSIGALQNIAQGQGTPIDAAKFMRDRGVTDVAQLQALAPGMPMRSGWAEQGLALSKLPDPVFNAVVQGDLTPARGAIIGASGKTPQEMEALWRYAQKGNISDRVLGELVAMTAPDATATPAVARQGSIWDALGESNEEAARFNANLLNKARLADRVRSLLSADRRLFAAVSSRGAAERLQSGARNTIDAAGSRTVADQAAQVLDVFDRLKYQVGPVGDLLNGGVVRLDAGERLDVVAKALSGEVADAMERTLTGDAGAAAGQTAEAAGQAPVPAAAAPRETAPMPTAEELAWAESKLLSPRKLANRQKYKAEYDANEAAVVAYLDEMPGSNSGKELSEEAFLKKYGADDSKHPQLMTKGKAKPKQLKELEDHLAAERILERQRMAEQAGPDAAAAVAPAVREPLPAEAPQRPARLSPAERERLQIELVQRAIDGDEVRPPITEAPALPHPSSVPLSRALDSIENEGLVLGNDAAQAVADEIRLAAEYAYRDAAVQRAMKEGQREASGYYEQPPGQRLASTEFREGFRDAPIGDSADTRLAYAREQRIAAERRGDAAVAREWRAAEQKLEKGQAAEGGSPVAPPQGEVPAAAAGAAEPLSTVFKEIRAAVEDAGKSDAGGVAWGPITIKWEADGSNKTLFVTPATALGPDELKALGVTRAEVAGMKAAEKAALLQDAIAQIRQALPPGEYLIDAAEETQRGAMVRALREDPGIRWMDVDTDEPAARPGPRTYGAFTVEEGAGGTAAAPSARPVQMVASPDGLVPAGQSQPLGIFGPMDLANRVRPMPDSQFALPPSAAKGTPRFGKAELQFGSDLDRAAYLLARDSSNGASRSIRQLKDALELSGLDPQDVARYGKETVLPNVRAAAAAGQADGLPLEIPAGDYRGQARLPAVERQALQADATALDAEISALDAEIDKITNNAADGGCY